jgi:tetratricopeptide (TPR) repeat protein
MEHEIRTLRAHFWSDRDPDGRAFAPLAEAYLDRGDVEEALALVQDGLGRLPDYATGHLVAARVHRVRGDQAAARGAVEALLALDRGNAPGLRLLGEISEEAGELQAAVDAFREALERDPGYADLEGRIARLEYPPTGAEAQGPAHSGDAGVADPGGRDPERPEREGPKPGAMADEPFEPGAPESPTPESLEHGSSHPGEEPFLIESFETFHGDLEGDLQEFDSEIRSGRESEPGAAPDPSPSSPEDLIFHSFDDPFEAPSDEDPSDEDPSREQASSGEPAPPLATRTMAELYIRQGFADRGVEVYRQLVRRDPEDPELRRRLEELESEARGETPGENLPGVGAAASDAPPAGDSSGIGEGTSGSEGGGAGGADGDDRVSLARGTEDDDPWGAAPQWTGEDPGTAAASDRSPFAWVPDPDDTEAEAVSEMEGRKREAAQEVRGGRGPSAGQYLQDLLAWEPGAVPIESLAPEAGPRAGDGGSPRGKSLSGEPGDDGGEGRSHPGSREG